MASNIFTKVFTLPTTGSGGTIDFTDSRISSETIKAVELFATIADTFSGTGYRSNQRAVGATDGSNSFAQTTYGEDDYSSTGCKIKTEYGTATSYNLLQMVSYSGGGVQGELRFNSWITNGIRCDIDSNFLKAGKVAITFYTGSDISAHVDTIAHLSSSGSIVYSSCGFAPDLVKFHSNGWTDNEGNYWRDGYPTIGFATRVANQNYCLTLDIYNGNADSEGVVLVRNDKCMYRNGKTSFNVSAWSSSGFTLSQSDPSNTAYDMVFLALKITGKSIKIIDTPLPTSTGNHSYTGAGFKPEFIQMILTHIASYNTKDLSDDNFVYGVGFNDGGDGLTIGHVKKANVTKTVEDGFARENISLLDENKNDDYIGTIDSLDSDGFTLNTTNAMSSGTNVSFALLIEGEDDADLLTKVFNRGLNRGIMRGIES